MNDPIWYHYEFELPQQDLPIIIKIKGEEHIVVPNQLSHEFNVAGLKWKPTRIFLEFEGTITRGGMQQASILSQELGAGWGDILVFDSGLGNLHYSANSRRAQ